MVSWLPEADESVHGTRLECKDRPLYRLTGHPARALRVDHHRVALDCRDEGGGRSAELDEGLGLGQAAIP